MRQEEGPGDQTGANANDHHDAASSVPQYKPEPLRCPDCGTADLVHLSACPVGRSLDDAAAMDRASFADAPVREFYRPLSWGECQHLPLTPPMRGIQPGDIITAMMRVTYVAPGVRMRGIGNLPWFIDIDVDTEGALDAISDFFDYCGPLPADALATYDERHHVATYHLNSTEVAA